MVIFIQTRLWCPGHFSFFRISSQQIPHSLPIRVRYGVSAVNFRSDSGSNRHCSAVCQLLCVITWYVELQYNGPWLYLQNTLQLTRAMYGMSHVSSMSDVYHIVATVVVCAGLKIRRICYAQDLWKLAWSWKQFLPDPQIYQVLPYSVDFKAPRELWNPLSKTVLSKYSFIWNKGPVNIWNDRKAQK